VAQAEKHLLSKPKSWVETPILSKKKKRKAISSPTMACVLRIHRHNMNSNTVQAHFTKTIAIGRKGQKSSILTISTKAYERWQQQLWVLCAEVARVAGCRAGCLHALESPGRDMSPQVQTHACDWQGPRVEHWGGSLSAVEAASTSESPVSFTSHTLACHDRRYKQWHVTGRGPWWWAWTAETGKHMNHRLFQMYNRSFLLDFEIILPSSAIYSRRYLKNKKR
jgi:hypothetical protein